MRLITMIAALALLAACSGGKQEEKVNAAQEAPKTGSLPAGAAASIGKQLEAYYSLKNALVEYDTTAANTAALALSQAADGISTEGIADTAMAASLSNFSETIASTSRELAAKSDLTEKKRSFSIISETLYPMLQAAQYNESVVYHQMCPMAFNDNETAFWLSNNREIENPYLGKKHPKYSSGMLHCGEVKDSLAYSK